MGENIAFVASLRLDVSDPSSSESEHSCWAGAAAGAFGGVARPDLRRHPAEAALNGVAIKPGALPLDHAGRVMARRLTARLRASGGIAGERLLSPDSQGSCPPG